MIDLEEYDKEMEEYMKIARKRDFILLVCEILIVIIFCLIGVIGLFKAIGA